MKSWARQLALGLLLSAAIPAGAALAADNAEQTLLDKAAYWRQQHRPDLARASLDQLLAAHPAQPDALYQYGALELQQGNAAAARTYLLRLQRIAPNDPRTARLWEAVRSFKTARASAARPVIGGRGPPPLEATARSVDSDGLIGAPAATGAAPAMMTQVASLESDTISDAGSEEASAAAAATATGPGTAPPEADTVAVTGGGQMYQQMAPLELTIPPPIGGYQPPAVNQGVPAQDSLQLDIERSMAEIRAESVPTLEAGAIYRGRVGQSGLSQLNEVGLPIEGHYSPWLTGTLSVSVSPVYLSAGSLSSGSLSVFGANGILAAHALPEIAPGTQDAGGVLTSVGYSFGPYSARIGDSAWGFPVNNIIGDVAYQPKFLNDTVSVRIEGQRTPVTDSLLSYSGTHASLGAANAVTGGAFGTDGTWGGVTKTGIHVSGFYDNNNIGAFGGFGISSLVGTNVAENSEVEAFLGSYFRPYRNDYGTVRVGVNLVYFGFDKNLSYYSFGQGGYFSPQNYEALTFPVEYQGKNGRWSYLGSVALGVQHFNQDQSPFFPNNPYAQGAMVAALGNGAYYSGDTTTGLAIDLRAQIEYALSNTLSVGAAGSFDNGHSYNEGVVKVYLRKTFSDPSPVTAILPGSPMDGLN